MQKGMFEDAKRYCYERAKPYAARLTAIVKALKRFKRFKKEMICKKVCLKPKVLKAKQGAC
jgi:hypothetical protein